MPALRHRKECYIDTEVICSYLAFFFDGDNDEDDGVGLSGSYKKKVAREGEDCVEGLFPNLGGCRGQCAEGGAAGESHQDQDPFE